MKPGTIIELPDGRIGTVVYNSLDGTGIKWGEHHITSDDIKGHGNLFREEPPENYQFFAEAMLREPYQGTELPCIGETFKIISEPEESSNG